MVKRNYNQACPLAASLDLIGERWTLLIIRDLLLGPLRFGDLARRLTGIGRNLLAARLKRLVERGLLEKRTLAPPARTTVYALTEAGLALEDTILSLSKWGIRYGVGADGLEGQLQPDLVGLGIKMVAQPKRIAGWLSFEVEVDGVLIGVEVESGLVAVQRGPAARPQVRLSGSTAQWGAVLSGATSLGDAVREGELAASGDPSTLRLVEALCAP